MLVSVWAVLASPVPASAQDYQEWSAETRTSFSFRVAGEAVRALLPDNWTVAAVAEAPDQVNLTVTFMNRQVILDPQGQPVGTGSSRYMVMSVQARDAGGAPGILIINGISPEGGGAYDVYQSAEVAMAERFLSGQSDDRARVQEHWVMVAESGDRISVILHYQQAVPTRRQSSIVIRSGKHTDYTRTYRIDQANDALGVPGEAGSRIGMFSFMAAGPLFSRLFDGTEVLLGITSTPWYHREIFVP
ncbi:MAG: hypothetical protein CMQ34_13270 [Gammaproteobacteria bacterium]|nr:hypothetical protein [Gammaproteobacteria bacterium]